MLRAPWRRLCSATAGVRYVFCCDFSLCNVLVLLEFTPRLSLGTSPVQTARGEDARSKVGTDRTRLYVPSSSIDTVLYTRIQHQQSTALVRFGGPCCDCQSSVSALLVFQARQPWPISCCLAFCSIGVRAFSFTKEIYVLHGIF